MSKHLITLTDPGSPASEAFRTLRTNLLFSHPDRALQTLLVTSPTQDADSSQKSITIANLAVTMAQSGRQTMLVDCDLRRGNQHKIWDVGNEEGLSTVLLQDSEMSIRDVGVENLSLLNAGPQPLNPADLLGSPKMRELIHIMMGQAEMVLFDAPPVLAVTDAALLASNLDGVLLVFSAGQTKRAHAARAKELLERVNINIVGAVLNNTPFDASIGAY